MSHLYFGLSLAIDQIDLERSSTIPREETRLVLQSQIGLSRTAKSPAPGDQGHQIKIG